MFELEGLTKVFRAEGGGTIAAVDRFSLRVEQGEQVAIVGPSGAGKSTLLRLLNGTLRPTSGRLRLEGKDLGALSGRALRELRRRVGTVHQQQNLVPRLRVVHNVLAGRLGQWPLAKSLFSLLSPREVELALGALERVGIPEKLWERTERLSGGQQQRVAIARVLVQSPAHILADEPVSWMDPPLAEEIVSLLCRVSTEQGATLLASLHSVRLALSHFPRVVGMREGAVLFDLEAGRVTEGLLVELYRGASVPSGREGAEGEPSDGRKFLPRASR
ncbi:MAG: phosphonate ABC transporter ATP-binding protein [Nitrospinota bacterium]